MANHEHVKNLRQGVEAGNKWRAEKAGKSALRGLGPDLRGADLAGLKQESYQMAFEQLLRDLRAEERDDQA